jgi:uncharacterized protein
MRRKWGKITLVVFVVLLPVIIHQAYRRMTALPKTVTLASGPSRGRYSQLIERLAAKIESRFPTTVNRVPSQGSLQNLKLLAEGKVDFALYQPGTVDVLEMSSRPDTQNVRFVANLYLQLVHFIVRRGAGIEGPADLPGKRVALGLSGSGDYAASLVLLKHFDIGEDRIDAEYLEYSDIERRFEAQTLDAAFITVGVQAPVLSELLLTHEYDVIDVPYAKALATKNATMAEYTIPAGLYSAGPDAIPATDVHTVALGAQLLTRENVPSNLVEKVTQTVLGEDFLKENRLGELIAFGLDFARQKPEFAIHPGAEGFYNPHMRPLLDPDFVDATEGLRSFVVSILIATFLGVRWLNQKRAKKKEHKLDRYVRSLLDIERRQVPLDDTADADDAKSLEGLLDEVTFLRQEALGSFTAHELTEDRAAECFVQMCHALSDKINAKISRQRLDRRLSRIAEKLGGG